jgi:hypothetical protein
LLAVRSRGFAQAAYARERAADLVALDGDRALVGARERERDELADVVAGDRLVGRVRVHGIHERRAELRGGS